MRLPLLSRLRPTNRNPSPRAVAANRRRGLFRVVPVLRGKYDAAQTTPDNYRHWANADRLSPDAAASPEVRAILRSRSRYEVANNSYARGIVLTLANDTIGTGPRLQMLTDDPAANTAVEQAFMRWAKSVGLAEKLRTMRMARAESGEAFAVLTHNPSVDGPVQLDVRLIEADRVTTPLSRRDLMGGVDGIEFDRHGNPTRYHVLRHHPGDIGGLAAFDEIDRVPAESVVHLFRADRPAGSVVGRPGCRLAATASRPPSR
jgi:capsid protein